MQECAVCSADRSHHSFNLFPALGTPTHTWSLWQSSSHLNVGVDLIEIYILFEFWLVMLSQAEKSPQKEHYWLARPVQETLQLVQVKCTKGRLTFFSRERLAESVLQGINCYMIFWMQCVFLLFQGIWKFHITLILSRQCMKPQLWQLSNHVGVKRFNHPVSTAYDEIWGTQ